MSQPLRTGWCTLRPSFYRSEGEQHTGWNNFHSSPLHPSPPFPRLSHPARIWHWRKKPSPFPFCLSHAGSAPDAGSQRSCTADGTGTTSPRCNTTRLRGSKGIFTHSQPFPKPSSPPRWGGQHPSRSPTAAARRDGSRSLSGRAPLAQHPAAPLPRAESSGDVILATRISN